MKNRLRLAGGIAMFLAGALILTNSVAPDRPTWMDAAPVQGAENTATQVAAGDERRPTPDVPSQPPAGSLPVSDGVLELEASGATMKLDPDGTIRTVTAAQGKNLAPNSDSFLQRFGGALGLTSSSSVRRVSSAAVPGGDQVLRYQQRAAGLPVLGGEIVVTVNGSGAVRSAITDTTPLAPVASAAKIGEADAKAKAIAAAAKEFTFPADGLRSEATLWLYDAGSEQGVGKPELRPTYRVRFFAEEHELATVLIDGLDGHTVLTASDKRSGNRRVVCDLNNTRVNLLDLNAYACNPFSPLGVQASTRTESGAASSVADVNAAFLRLGNAANYFRTSFGRDSYDGSGGEIRATVRACDVTECKFENAFWDGYQFVFGDGWAIDDVAAHEYTHAVTEHASTLFYWQQSGAINEALSDIFGEFIDLSIHDDGTDDTNKRWQMGENIPDGAFFNGTIRDMMNPGLYGQPTTVYGPLWVNTNSDNGGVHTNSGPANVTAARIADGYQNQYPGIGLAKSGQLWYRVMHLLPSGAGYATLKETVMSACLSLIGHYGFTPTDCTVTVAGGIAPISTDGNFQTAVCGNGSPDLLAFDDMEHNTGAWQISDVGHWFWLPSTDIPQTYAFSGRGSLNGWSGGSGNGHWLEMATPITLNQHDVQLAFASSFRSKGGVQMRVQVDDGSTLTELASFTSGSFGYGIYRTSLEPFFGKTIRIRLQMVLTTGTYIDWYLDDFAIYRCGGRPAPANTAYGVQTASGLQLNWSGFPGSVWELSYDPPIPGAPTSVPAGSAPYNYSLLVPNADRNTTYRVTLKGRADGGLLGDPYVIVVPLYAPVVCPTGMASLFLVFSGSRPAPPLAEGQCTRQLVPQRR